MLDSLTGTLLVQGSARNFTTGAGVNDTINLQRVVNGEDDNILVTVNGTAERIPFAQVKDIIVHGNGGTDTITVNPNVTQPWQQVQYVVSGNQDALEISTSVGGSSTTNGIIDLSSVIPGSQTTLRAAIIEANSAGGARGIYVGRGIYNLTLNGTGGDTQGDLDITGNVTIVGAGAGATIINASTLTARDRVFEINGANRSLNLARVTVTGGNTSAFPGSTGIGGGISVIGASAALTLTDSAVVGNTGKSFGGGIYTQGTTTITRSVLAGNHLASSSLGGGGIYASSGTVSLGSTIVANNTATIGPQDISGTDPYWTSLGNNLLTSIQSPLVDNFSQPGDYVGSVNYIVTSVADSYDQTDNTRALSIREAVDLANTNDGTPETIWLPAWSFVLTRERQNGVGFTDTDVAFGDLDIKDSLTIRGITASSTRVAWKPGVIDAIFDLLGDFDGNGLAEGPDGGGVDGRDQLIHGRQNGNSNGIDRGQSSADGDDDGDVDGDDLIVWQNNYGNYLLLTNVTPILA